MTNICYLNKSSYAKKEDWLDFIKAGKTLDNIPYHMSWTPLFAKLRKRNKYNKITTDISDELKKNKHQRIYPKPEFVFGSFLICSAADLKVVILGQDPYYKSEHIDNNVHVPQATGLAFSVADDFAIPSSLQNIYRNMVHYGHIDEMPDSGNLWFWASQGCLMLNTALTVKHDDKKSHSGMWKWMTDEMIKYISKYFDGIVFVLWGSDAYAKIDLIDQDRHDTIITSHPSSLSAYKSFRKFPAFNDFDHFGEINANLKKIGKAPILWK